MRSAYLVLGIPGNASMEDVELAFERARQLYTPQRVASVEGTVDKFNEVKMAYEVLRDPESRAAHDRKLAAGHRPKPVGRPVQVVQEDSPYRRFLVIGLLLAGVIFAAGFFVSYKNAEARRQQAALELAVKEQAAKEEERQRLEAVRLDQERAQAKLKAEADERRIASEGRVAAAQAGAERSRQEATALQMQRNAVAEAQRQEATLRMEEQRNASEARRRVEMDKRRIRELCYQQYRRPDC